MKFIETPESFTTFNWEISESLLKITNTQKQPPWFTRCLRKCLLIEGSPIFYLKSITWDPPRMMVAISSNLSSPSIFDSECFQIPSPILSHEHAKNLFDLWPNWRLKSINTNSQFNGSLSVKLSAVQRFSEKKLEEIWDGIKIYSLLCCWVLCEPGYNKFIA